MSELTLVSAFFDIGRGGFTDTVWIRSNEQYFSYFRFWARMKNPLIVYTQPQFEQKILEIRAGFGLGEKTRVVVVDDIFAAEPALYRRMEAVSQNEKFRNTRFDPRNMANRADYDYVMLMKYWCLADAVRRGYAAGTVAWFDFGFNHGGACYPYPGDFDYTWEYEFSPKIHLFTLRDPNEICALEQVLLQYDSIMGCLLVLPDRLCLPLWELVKKAAEALLMLDCIDDDQMLLLMACKERPDLFEIHRSGWFLPLKEYGGGHLRTAVPPRIPGCRRAMKKALDFMRGVKNFRRVGTPYHFARRMYRASKERHGS